MNDAWHGISRTRTEAWKRASSQTRHLLPRLGFQWHAIPNKGDYGLALIFNHGPILGPNNKIKHLGFHNVATCTLFLPHLLLSGSRHSCFILQVILVITSYTIYKLAFKILTPERKKKRKNETCNFNTILVMVQIVRPWK